MGMGEIAGKVARRVRTGYQALNAVHDDKQKGSLGDFAVRAAKIGVNIASGNFVMAGLNALGTLRKYWKPIVATILIITFIPTFLLLGWVGFAKANYSQGIYKVGADTDAGVAKENEALVTELKELSDKSVIHSPDKDGNPVMRNGVALADETPFQLDYRVLGAIDGAIYESDSTQEQREEMLQALKPDITHETRRDENYERKEVKALVTLHKVYTPPPTEPPADSGGTTPEPPTPGNPGGHDPDDPRFSLNNQTIQIAFGPIRERGGMVSRYNDPGNVPGELNLAIPLQEFTTDPNAGKPIYQPPKDIITRVQTFASLYTFTYNKEMTQDFTKDNDRSQQETDKENAQKQQYLTAIAAKVKAQYGDGYTFSLDDMSMQVQVEVKKLQWMQTDADKQTNLEKLNAYLDKKDVSFVDQEFIWELVKDYDIPLEMFEGPGGGPLGGIDGREFGGGVLGWPLNGYNSPEYVTSKFGMRFHPTKLVWKLHTGVDFGVPQGTQILAAADGKVVYAGWAGDYGVFVIIYHGMVNGAPLYTAYAHQLPGSLLVKAGDEVVKGQQIGQVGSTGASTGAHLHFEVRVGGTDFWSATPKDPIGYLSGSNLSQSEFIKTIVPGALDGWSKYHVLPSISLAQAALESGWGKYHMGSANNLFGIKVSNGWTGPYVELSTREYVNGEYITVTAKFRAYPSFAASVEDHGSFLAVQNAKRYTNVINAANYAAAAESLERAGYATSPTYAENLIKLIEQYGWQQYDN